MEFSSMSNLLTECFINNKHVLLFSSIYLNNTYLLLHGKGESRLLHLGKDTAVEREGI